jgi:hypothetical protein
VGLPVDQPQVLVQIAGVTVPGVTFMEVEHVGYFAADRFRVGFVIGAADFTTAQYFSSLGMQVITISAAIAGSGFLSLITGQIDNIEIDFGANNVVLAGRDLAARLIDAELSETYVNQTASQVAIQIAEQFNLTPDVTSTSTMIGQYYEIDHARVIMNLHSRNMTPWDLLTGLAYVEGFSLSVSGTVLNFGPAQAGSVIGLTIKDFSQLMVDTATTVPTGTMVKSWNTRDKKAIMQRAGEGVSSIFIRPNLSSSQAGDLAASHLALLNLHKTVLVGTMPADLTTMPGQQFLLSGTESLFDQTYTVEVIRRSVRANRRFSQTMRAFANS